MPVLTSAAPVSLVMSVKWLKVVFGAGKLPQVGEAISRGVRFLRGGKREEAGLRR